MYHVFDEFRKRQKFLQTESSLCETSFLHAEKMAVCYPLKLVATNNAMRLESDYMVFENLKINDCERKVTAFRDMANKRNTFALLRSRKFRFKGHFFILFIQK